MKINIQNKLAIVTGGASGIGYAITEKFVGAGIRTVIIGRNQQKLAEAKDQLGELCIPVCFDLNDLKSIPKQVKQIEDKLGSIDILVNNAGINLKKEFTEVSDEEFESIMRTNVSSVFALSREAVKYMMKRGRGNIINISSMASQYGLPKVIAYTASKSAIEGMTRAMAVELSPRGILVNCIAPGFIATAMSGKALNSDAERMHKVISRTPLGKLGNPADVAEAAYFLASEKSGYLTGVILPVDGGNSIGF
ncbi:MAG TPA: SDR family oxidoreductase [Puia sp.]|jgi:NAD(P)-dependent dehydrogenase (short-subunit alcohol dehydrogenase family)|nr:SDR family oxidoreductase [Puia sp.]